MQMIRFVEFQIIFLKTRNPNVTQETMRCTSFSLVLLHFLKRVFCGRKIMNSVLKLVSLSVKSLKNGDFFPLRHLPAIKQEQKEDYLPLIIFTLIFVFLG